MDTKQRLHDTAGSMYMYHAIHVITLQCHMTHFEISLEPLLYCQNSLSKQRELRIQHLCQQLYQGGCDKCKTV